MTLQIAEGFKLSKSWRKYLVVVITLCITSMLLSTLIFCDKSFAEVPLEAVDIKLTKDKMNKMTPDSIAMARYCIEAENHFDSRYRDDDHYRNLYNRCSRLGYCPGHLDHEPSDSALGDDGKGGTGPVCKDAYRSITAKDCLTFETIMNTGNDSDHHNKADLEGLVYCQKLNCNTKKGGNGPCCIDKNCKRAHEKVAENQKLNDAARAEQDKKDTIVNNVVNLICNDSNAIFHIDTEKCRSTLPAKASECVDKLRKDKNVKEPKITDVYDCIKKDKNLKNQFKLPDNINVSANSNQTFDEVDNSDQKKCSDNAGFFGFFWCPGINMLTEVFDTITGMITGGLKWTILVDTRASSEHVNKDPHHIIYNTWSSVLSVANIVMIIGFIAILYSYALNSNNVAKAYNVKTLMSRLIIVAIATNFSFYICAALADLSNIAGVGIYDLIRDTIPGNGDGPFSISGLGTAISVVVGATILIVLAYMSLHLVILSLIIILALITLRQIALLMLVIVSPLAFACYLFPNTAKWFTKWWNYYIQLLIVFPLFTAVWASSRLVASVLELTHQSNLITTVLSAVTPLLAIIPIFKMSGGLMSKMTNGLQKRASKWEGRDNLRRKRVANFAKRNSMALQNKLGSVQLGDHGMGRILSGAAHLAGGGIGLVGGTLAAAANARASDNLDELSGQAVKDINKEYEEKQQKKADEKIEEFAKKNHSISDEMASTIEQTIGNNPVKYTKNETGGRSNPIITGTIAIKYMAMTGRGVDGKLLDQNTYRAALKYADEHIVMNNDEFNIAVYNVQQNGDKDTRSDFIKRHTDPDKSNHSIFMSQLGQNDFINQTGTFSKNRFESDDELANIAAQELTQKGTSTGQAQINIQKSTLAGESLDYSRRQYISSLNSAGYNNLSDAARYKLARQTILRKDTASANRIRALHTRVHHDINIIKVNDNTKHNMEVIDKALRSFTDKHSGHGSNL